MSGLLKNKYFPFFILFILVLVSRFPFLSAGYGVEEDSWGIALATFHTKLTGIYEPSRFPGHPVQELIYSALWGYGPWLYNFLCAFFSAIATVFFALILQHLNFKHVFLAALAFAFVPVVYISSTYTIDFIWSEAFVLMSFYCLLRNRLIFTGMLLGLAVGCRITCGVMLLPYLLILWEQNNLKQNFISLIKIAIPMALVALIVFMPIIIQFGSSFFMYYDQFPYPPITKVIYKMTLGVFGVVGFLCLCFLMIRMVIKKEKRGELYGNSLPSKILMISYLIIILYCISYFRLPQKSGYMIPVIPFVIILFGYYLNAKQFRLLSFALIISSFIFSINLTDKLRGATYSDLAVIFKISGQEIFFDPITGPLLSDYSKRKQKIKYTEEVIQKSDSLNLKTVIIAGWWYNEIMVTSIGKSENDHVIVEAYITEEKMKDYSSKGYKIVYLPEQNIFNDQMFGIKNTGELASPF